MKNKINIAEILKDCPQGMELDCTIYENCELLNIDTSNDIHSIRIKTPDGQIVLNKYGCYHNTDNAKCVIFPKGKTTWEGFIPFVAGDVIYTDNFIAILSHITEDGAVWYHCYYYIPSKTFKAERDFGIGNINYGGFRLATEEEKEKLFDIIKTKGYYWNDKTKTLEKLVKPKFKVGDTIQDIDSYKVKITEVNIEDGCYEYESTIAKGIGSIMFSNQDDWELVPDIKPKFKVGDKIEKCGYKFTITEVKDDYYLTKCGNKIPIDNQDDFSLVPNKFDINTLKPFDKVLVRCGDNGSWNPQFFAKYNSNSKFPFACTYNSWSQCIPYEGNEHLLDTTNDCDEYFKIW